MGLFGDKDKITTAALGASGAFDKDKETNIAAAYGIALGACIASGKKWTVKDALKLGGAIKYTDAMKKRK